MTMKWYSLAQETLITIKGKYWELIMQRRAKILLMKTRQKKIRKYNKCLVKFNNMVGEKFRNYNE